MQVTLMAGVVHTKTNLGLEKPLWTLHTLPWLADACRAGGYWPQWQIHGWLGLFSLQGQGGGI